MQMDIISIIFNLLKNIIFAAFFLVMGIIGYLLIRKEIKFRIAASKAQNIFTPEKNFDSLTCEVYAYIQLYNPKTAKEIENKFRISGYRLSIILKQIKDKTRKKYFYKDLVSNKSIKEYFTLKLKLLNNFLKQKLPNIQLTIKINNE